MSVQITSAPTASQPSSGHRRPNNLCVVHSQSPYERIGDRVQRLERYRLGEAILNPSMAHDMVAVLRPEQFTQPLYRAVFRAIVALIDRGAPDVDVGMVCDEMDQQGTLKQFTLGTSQVCEITEGAVVPPSYRSRVFRIKEMLQAWDELKAARGANANV